MPYYGYLAVMNLISGQTIAAVDYIAAQSEEEAQAKAFVLLAQTPAETALWWGIPPVIGMAGSITSFELKFIGVLDGRHPDNAALLKVINSNIFRDEDNDRPDK